jgi:hypothetical protein
MVISVLIRPWLGVSTLSKGGDRIASLTPGKDLTFRPYRNFVVNSPLLRALKYGSPPAMEGR